MNRFYGDVDIPSRNYPRRNESPQMNWNMRNSFSNPRDYYRNRESVVRKNVPNSYNPPTNFDGHAGNHFTYPPPQQYNNFQRYHYFGESHDSRNYHSQQHVFSFHPRMPFINVTHQNLQQGPSSLLHPIYKPPELHPSQNKNLKKDSKESSQKSQESAKKEALAAELKKSLRNFQKNHSQNSDHLLVLDKSKESNTSPSTSQHQPCFPWDLPLTVDDLKSIGRGKTGNTYEVCADSCNENELFSLERQFTFQDKERTKEPSVDSSPEVQIIKQCRKRQRSESIEVISKKTKLNCFQVRRRHRSASPNLCEEIIPEDIGQSIHSSLDNLSTRVSNDDSNLTPKPKVDESPKPNPSNTLMQLLGVKRRELNEMVEQPRNPRVQFMLSLLMKRHKELLVQRAIRSRFSTLRKEFTPNCKAGRRVRTDIQTEMQKITSSSLEGLGASDTIDCLSNILLESSLTVDISSLPQELIDQLGTFLEMGVDFGNLSEELSINEEGNLNASGKSIEVPNEPICDGDNTDAIIDDTFKRKEITREKDLSHQIETERKDDNKKVKKRDDEKRLEQDKKKHSGSRVEIGSPSHSGRIKGDNLKGEKKQSLSKKNKSSSREKSRNTLTSGSGQWESRTSCIEEAKKSDTQNSETADIQEVIIDRSPLMPVHSNSEKDNVSESEQDSDALLARMWEIDQKIKELMDEKQQLYEKLQSARLNETKSQERRLTVKESEVCPHHAVSISSSTIKDSPSDSVIPLVTSPSCSPTISQHSSTSKKK